MHELDIKPPASKSNLIQSGIQMLQAGKCISREKLRSVASTEWACHSTWPTTSVLRLRPDNLLAAHTAPLRYADEEPVLHAEIHSTAWRQVLKRMPARLLVLLPRCAAPIQLPRRRQILVECQLLVLLLQCMPKGMQGCVTHCSSTQ